MTLKRGAPCGKGLRHPILTQCPLTTVVQDPQSVPLLQFQMTIECSNWPRFSYSADFIDVPELMKCYKDRFPACYEYRTMPVEFESVAWVMNILVRYCIAWPYVPYSPAYLRARPPFSQDMPLSRSLSGT